MLLGYFDQHRFNERISWVNTHLSPIIEQLQQSLCLCPYRLTFKRALEKLATLERRANRQQGPPLSAAIVITELLADLHNRAGATQIRKLIKTPPPIMPSGPIYSEERRSTGVLGEYRFGVEKAKELQDVAESMASEYAASELSRN